MNKKLVAVAVAGVLAAPLAAQAQTANVTLYGRLNIDYGSRQRQADDPNRPTARTTERLPRRARTRRASAFAARESLGGGLNAIFQIESSINGDTRRRHAGRSRNVRRPARRLGYVQDGLLPGARTTTSTRSSVTCPTLHDVDPVDGRRCGRKAPQAKVARRLRRAPRQLGPLRLAEHRRLHGSASRSSA